MVERHLLVQPAVAEMGQPQAAGVVVAELPRTVLAMLLEQVAPAHADTLRLPYSETMNFAVYNPTTNRILTWVTEAKGAIPDGYEFRAEADVPPSAQVEVQQPPPTPIPEEVPVWAFRLALEKVGMLDHVLTFVQSLPHDARREAETHLEYGNYIRRDHPLMAAAAQLGLGSAKVDDIFRVADELKDGVADFGEVAVGPENSAERTLWNRVKGGVSGLFGGG